MAPQAGVNGVLPVAVLQRNAPAQQPPRGPKAAQPRLKLVLRRLPPGLTKAEFENAVGDDWKAGAGKVDWFSYKKGKITKEYASAHLHKIWSNIWAVQPNPRGPPVHTSMLSNKTSSPSLEIMFELLPSTMPQSHGKTQPSLARLRSSSRHIPKCPVGAAGTTIVRAPSTRIRISRTSSRA
jgi:hypothetical protein